MPKLWWKPPHCRKEKAVLIAEHVTKTYRKGKHAACAVKDASLQLVPGELTVLAGGSGSGKTTVARMLAGIISPTKGTVMLDGKSIVPPSRKKDKQLRAKIQMVLQDGKSALDPRFSVYRSIAEPIRNLLQLSKQDERDLVFSLMESVELPVELADRLPAELSGGQQKRVGIARALAPSPEYLIFDEVTSGLDVLLKKKILSLIRRTHQKSGTATLMITHDMDAALYMADRILVMQNGEIVEDRRYTGDTSCLTHPYSRLLLREMDPVS